MILIFILILEFLISGFGFKIGINADFIGVGFALINTIIIIFYLTKKVGNKRIVYIIFTGYIIRVIFLLIDYFAFRIPPHSGWDSEAFNREATQIYYNLEYMSNVGRGFYSQFLGGLYLVGGVQRFLAQYLNVITGILFLIESYNVFSLLKVKNKTNCYLIIFLTFFPHNILFSAILLRESIIGYTVVLSLKYFIYWVDLKKYSSVMKCVLSIVIGAIFHSGVIGICIAYIFGFIFYDHEEQKVIFKQRKILLCIGVLILILILNTITGNLILQKFKVMESKDGMFDWLNIEMGGSAYLTNLKVNSYFDMILFAPIKLLYFWISPVPWEFRGLVDIISFIFDSTAYIFLGLNIYRKRGVRLKKEQKFLVNIMMLGFFLSSLVFSFGTFNSGTALRHRNKVLVLLVIVYSIMKTVRGKNEKRA